MTAGGHLKHAVLGFARGGVLGAWLRALCCGAEDPSVRQRAAELGEMYTDVADWRRRLEAICAEAGGWLGRALLILCRSIGFTRIKGRACGALPGCAGMRREYI